jgi:hypothetical protein
MAHDRSRDKFWRFEARWGRPANFRVSRVVDPTAQPESEESVDNVHLRSGARVEYRTADGGWRPAYFIRRPKRRANEILIAVIPERGAIFTARARPGEWRPAPIEA